MKTLFTILAVTILFGSVRAQTTPAMDSTRYAQLKNVYSHHQIDSMLLLKASASRTYNLSTRTLNTAFQPSTTHDCIVIYYVSLSETLNLSGGQTGTVTLKISSSNPPTTVQAVNSNGNTGTLTLTLVSTQTQQAPIIGFVPAGYWVNLVTAGTGTISYQNGIEISL